MTHDKFCPRHSGQLLCLCATIRRVRDDEQLNMPDHWQPVLSAAYDRGFNAGLDAATEAVESFATPRELRSPSGLELDLHETLQKIRAIPRRPNPMRGAE